MLVEALCWICHELLQTMHVIRKCYRHMQWNACARIIGFDVIESLTPMAPPRHTSMAVVMGAALPVDIIHISTRDTYRQELMCVCL